MKARYKPVDPDKARREMAREFKGFDKEEPGPERAERLAAFARAAHAERQLNMAMHTASLCLDDDPDAPKLLLAAYEDANADGEARLRAHADLADLARYLDRPDVQKVADERLYEDALSYYQSADKQERRYRIRTLASVVDQKFADRIRDQVEYG